MDSNSKLGCMCALGAQLRGRPWPIASYTQIKNVKMVGDAIHQTPYDVGGKKQDYLHAALRLMSCSSRAFLQKSVCFLGSKQDVSAHVRGR